MADKEYMRNYMRNRYHYRLKVAKKKLGSKCNGCGITCGLTLTRLASADKGVKLAQIWSASEDKFLAALKNYQLLCFDCKHKETSHGTLSSYKHCRCVECLAAKSKYNREYKCKQ